MRRPTTKQVDEAIALVRGGLEAADPDEWSAHDILATEVQALRGVIARVEALRQYFYCEVGASDTFTALQVDGLMEAALNGDRKKEA